MRAIGLATLCLISFAIAAMAQTDEIQVYDGEIAPPGIFNLEQYQGSYTQILFLA